MRSTGNYRHLRQLHRARKLERNARFDIDWCVYRRTYRAPKITRS